jgi:hypothetical protein
MGLKYVLLILSVIVLFFVFYRQYIFGKQWQNYQNRIEMMTGLTETPGLTGNTDSCEDYSTADFNNLPLREYCIKSSFNSAYDGNSNSATSKDVLLQRIKEGYRFIDLNVFSASGDIYVGFDINNSPTLISGNLKLYDALKTISDNAFSKTASDFATTQMSNVGSYPVFVHIRVYRPPESKIDIVSNIAKIITGKTESNTSPPPFKVNYLLDDDGNPKQINSCTKLSDIMGKMIFSMDILNILEIYAPSNDRNASALLQQPDAYNTLPSMQTFVNVLTGGSTIPAFYEYTDDTIINRTIQLGISDASLKNSLQTNVKYMYIAFPHPYDVSQTNSSNPDATGVIQPDINLFILNRSIQITPLRVYLGDDSDKNLSNYNNIFEKIGYPFAPMMRVYTYLKPN